MAQRQYTRTAADVGDKPRPRLSTVRASDVVKRPTRWLWDNQLPLGKLTMMAGQAKIGKSHLTADISACVVGAKAWPDQTRCAHTGSVLILSAEDDLADTMVPRLEAAGLSGEWLEWVEILDGIDDGEGKVSGFDFAAGFEALKDYSDTHDDLRLVIIDPVLAYMGAKDSHKAAEVRNALMPYTKLAAERGFGILGITHLNRSMSTNAFDRVMASGAFTQIARANFLVAHDKQEDGRRLLIPFGTNLAELSEGFAYTIEGAAVAGVDHDGQDAVVKTSRVRWQGRVDITPEEALERENGAGGDRRTKQDEASDLILTALTRAGGRMASTLLRERVTEAGVSGGTYEKAHKKLSAAKRIHAKRGEGEDARWYTVLAI